MSNSDSALWRLQARVDILVEQEAFDEAEALLEQERTAQSGSRLRGSFSSTLNALTHAVRNARTASKLVDNPERLQVLVQGDHWPDCPDPVQGDLTSELRGDFAVWSFPGPSNSLAATMKSEDHLELVRLIAPNVFVPTGALEDLFGCGRFAQMLRQSFAGAGMTDIFNIPVFETVLARVIRDYRQIIATLHVLQPDLHILIVGYGGLRPQPKGRWFGTPLQVRNIPLNLGQDALNFALRRLDEELHALVKSEPTNVHYVDLGVGATDEDWQAETVPPEVDRAIAASELAKTLRHIDGLRSGDAVQTADVAETIPAEPLAPILEQLHSAPIELGMRRRAHGDGGRQLARRELSDILKSPQREDAERIATRIAYSNVTRAPARAAGGSISSEGTLCAFGAAATRAVARIYIRGSGGGFGTGFLIGNGLLMTNHHLLPDREMAELALASFGHETDAAGRPKVAHHFPFDGRVFLTSPRLDYTIISLSPTTSTGMSLVEFGALPLLPRTGKALIGEQVHLIHHPGGALKDVARRQNRVLGYQEDFLYISGAKGVGSPGAPWFNEEWQIAAMHHMVVKVAQRHRQVTANRAVRISSILADIAERSVNSTCDAAQITTLIDGSTLSKGRLQAHA